MNDPKYPEFEIWGGYCDDLEIHVEAEHIEDCFSLEEARKGCDEIRQQRNRYAFVKDKNTGKIL